MFEEEATQISHGRPSYLCIILSTEDGVQGLLFIDAITENAFGSDAPAGGSEGEALKVAKELEEHQTCKILAKAVGEVMKPLRLLGPNLTVDRHP
jgi:hypothetical protein